MAFIKDIEKDKKPPCIHGKLCKAYLEKRHTIYSTICPKCEFYEPITTARINIGKVTNLTIKWGLNNGKSFI